MKHSVLFLLLLLLFGGMINCEDQSLGEKQGTQNKMPEDLQIFLLIGQSNMAGRAEIEEEDKDSLDKVFLFTGIGNNEWGKAANPLNKYSTVRKDLSMQKLGPGYSFARKIAESMIGEKIGLVVNAKGGTSIMEWMPGQLLYNEAIKQAKEAMKFGALRGIVWHQGESDASKADTYLEKITELIKSLRTDLGNPDLPFVAGQLSEDRPERHDFNVMIMQLPSMVKLTGVATTEGTVTMEGTHFNSASQRLLGERYAAEMLKLLQK